jgi:membrane protease subunit (stomatin/prohibitin family)
MGLFDKFSGQFVDIVEWLDATNDTIVYRFQRYNNEIKMGAKLTVRPGQMAVFVNEGQIADVFEPGLYELVTRNLPILSTLKGWQYGFNSPFKAEIYFFSTRNFTNLKWGTSNPITIRDPELGPVRMRAYGTYSIKVVAPDKFLQELVSTDGLFQVEEVSDQVRNMIVTAFTSWLGQAKIPLLDLASRYSEMGETVRTGIQTDLLKFGLELTQLLIENVSLPPEVEAALDKRASIGILGNMQPYTQYQAANALEQSAKTPGSGTPGLNLGVGLAMGQQMANAFQTPAPGQATPAAPPPPVQWYITRDGQNLGPFAPDQLLQQGLTRQTYVWRAGFENWTKAADVPDLAALLGSVPPPPMLE